MRFNGSLVISNDPVMNWERFSLTLGPDRFSQLRPEIRADEWYRRLSFRIHGSRLFLTDMMSRALGREVRLFNHVGIKIWEGKIVELVFDDGVAPRKNSLVEMGNEGWLRYRAPGGSSPVRSTTLSDVDSKGRYGTKQFVMMGGELESLAIADQAIQQALNLRKAPKPSAASFTSGVEKMKRPSVKVMCVGYWDTLNWQVYNQTAATGNQGASAEVLDIITAKGQFVKSSTIGANGTLVNKVYDTDRRPGDIISSIAGLGDSGYRRWIAGMRNDREFFFQQAARATPKNT